MSWALYLVKHYRLFLLGLGVVLFSYGLAVHAVTVQVTGVVIFLYAVLGGG
jgi:hypothetical protein